MTTKKVLATTVGLTTALFLAAPSAMASVSYNHHYGNQNQQQVSDITVSNTSSAYVTNTVSATASTGGNTANGGNGDIGGNATANGQGSAVAGNGGNGGIGGGIQTGAAWAGSYITNKVNLNKTTIDTSCGCAGDIDVTNDNHANVTNTVSLEAKTGYNTANGGNGNNGGNATTNGGSQSHNYHHNYSSNGGNAFGGNGGEGGMGGVIITGNADAHSSITNKVNRNITRIVRTSAD